MDAVQAGGHERQRRRGHSIAERHRAADSSTVEEELHGAGSACRAPGGRAATVAVTVTVWPGIGLVGEDDTVMPALACWTVWLTDAGSVRDKADVVPVGVEGRRDGVRADAETLSWPKNVNGAKVALLLLFRLTVWVTGLLSSWKVTVSLVGRTPVPGSGVTVAVNVTPWPYTVGLTDDDTVTVAVFSSRVRTT